MLLERRAQMFKRKLILFEDGIFNPILGSIKTSGQWDYSPANANIAYTSTINISVKGVGATGYSNYLENAINTDGFSTINFNFDRPSISAGTPSFGWFIVFTRGIYHSTVSGGYTTIIGTDGLSQWIDPTTTQINETRSNSLNGGNRYLGFGVNKWSGTVYTTSPLKINKIWLE